MRRAALSFAMLACQLAIPALAGERNVVRGERGERPAVIAHRGASGYLPEHTLSAYTLAFAQGADMIEPDVVLTRDGVLVCAHDIVMDHTTNVADAYPGRARSDGHFYWADFTLAEVRTLWATGRRYEGEALPGHRVPTLDEMLSLVVRLNEAFGRGVGVIPEPKSPAFHAEQGLDIASALLRTLRAHGYADRSDACVVQCFELEALRRMHDELGTELRLVYLLGERPSEEELDDASSFCVGLGPSWKVLFEDDASLAHEARDRGLALYPYTFKKDRAEIARVARLEGVEGMFCDYPDIAIEVIVGLE